MGARGMYPSSAVEVFRCTYIFSLLKKCSYNVLPTSQRKLMIHHLLQLLNHHKSVAFSHLPSSYKRKWLTKPKQPSPGMQGISRNFEVSDSCGWERSVLWFLLLLHFSCIFMTISLGKSSMEHCLESFWVKRDIKWKDEQGWEQR